MTSRLTGCSDESAEARGVEGFAGPCRGRTPEWAFQSAGLSAPCVAVPGSVMAQGPGPGGCISFCALPRHRNRVFPLSLQMQTYVISVTGNERANVSRNTLSQILDT